MADPVSYESEHVHAVYAAIAPHFSDTRHSPWPAVARFLAARPVGAVGVDVGCGNGKYLALRPDLCLLGCDRSLELVRLAAGRLSTKTITTATTTFSSPADDVCVADTLALPFARARADFALCIAVVHHLSTRARRQAAIASVLGCVAPRAGRALVYVWALEQSASRRKWDAGGEQDLLVPWVVTASQRKKMERAGQTQGTGQETTDQDTTDQDTTDQDTTDQDTDQTFYRYYHLYREGELDEDVRAAGGVVLESGYERDNWWVVCGWEEPVEEMKEMEEPVEDKMEKPVQVQ